MTYENILCIIDVEEYFNPPTDFVERILLQIHRAKKQNYHIVPVRLYDKYVPNLIQEIGDHPHTLVKKFGQGGGQEILEALKQKEIIPLQIKVCGLYTDMCVLDTVVQLRAKLTPERVDVIEDAVYIKKWTEELVSNPNYRQQKKEQKG